MLEPPHQYDEGFGGGKWLREIFINGTSDFVKWFSEIRHAPSPK